MAQNYGSLVVRILLQPTEEAARLLFSKQGQALKTATSAAAKANIVQDGHHASAASVGSSSKSRNKDGANEERHGHTSRISSKLAEAERAAIAAAMATSLALLLKAVSLLGLVVLSFGPPFVPSLLILLPGERWAAVPEATSTLQWYCGYICTLALNGSLEAFVYATADERQVGWLTVAHLVFSGLFAASTLPAMAALGTAGVVAANALVMACRATYAAVVSGRFLAARGARLAPSRCLPRAPVLAALATAALASHWSEAGRASGASVAVFTRAFLTFLPTSSSGRIMNTLAMLQGSGGKGSKAAVLFGVALHMGVGVAALGGVVAAVVKFEGHTLAEFRTLTVAAKQEQAEGTGLGAPEALADAKKKN